MENNGLQIFENEEFGKIRTIEIGGKVWFVGKDVAAALGYSNPQKALRDHVDDEGKTVNEMFTVNGTMGVLINESGLYSLILSSKLPTARKFQRWVINNILPSAHEINEPTTDNLKGEIIMNNLQLVKSSRFGDVECDIYSDNDEMYMTIAQLAECLGYADRKGIEKIVERNSYLKNPEFSVTVKLSATDGKYYNTRVFSEDGIYEVTFLSKTEIAGQFRAWVRKLLKSLRSGKAAIVKTDRLDDAQLRIESDKAAAMRINAENERLKLLMECSKLSELSPVARQTWIIKSIEGSMGLKIAELPECEKLYQAGTLAEVWSKEFGVKVTSAMLGKLANQNGLKSDEYGVTAMDKSPYSSKEAVSFRYNEKGAEKLKALAKAHYCG